jgi:hypothetical protein
MLLQVIPESATLSCTADCDSTRNVLCLDCTAADSAGVLEIGDGHVFASKANRSFFGKRQSCNLRVRITRKSALTAEAIEKMNLSTSKIGDLGFYPASEAGDFFPPRPASLEATLFIGDELHDRLLGALQVGRKPTWLHLEVEREGVLGFGWEPDGSRIVWKLESETEPSHVDVQELSIGINLFD